MEHKGEPEKCIWMVLAFLSWALVRPCQAGGPASLEELVLARKWQKLHQVISADDANSAGAVARFVMGHACLRTNRNDEAFILFLSLSPAEAKSCLKWARGLVAHNQSNCVAHYMLGDALARNGQTEAALGEFSKAIKHDPTMAMAWNARGALRAATAENEDSLYRAAVDLARATRLAPDFADGHANSGAVWVSLRAADGAVKAFDKALALNAEFALAHNGRGCANYGCGRFDKAFRDFQVAEQLMPVLVVARSNQASVLVATETMICDANCDPPGGEIRSDSALAKIDLTSPKARLEMPTIIRTHGLPAVQQRIGEQMRDVNAKITAGFQWQKGNERATRRWGPAYVGAEFTKQAITLGGAGRTLIKDGFKRFLGDSALAVGKAGASWGLGRLPDSAGTWTARIILNSVDTNPIGIAGGGGTELAKIGIEEAWGDRRIRAGANTKMMVIRGHQLMYLKDLQNDIGKWAVEQRIADGLGLPGPLTVQPPAPVPVSSKTPPRYYTSADRPLPEAGALASMLDKTIPAASGRPRRALVFGGDGLRTNILERVLRQRKFEVLHVPSTAKGDVAELSKNWGADVIAGVKSLPRSRAMPPPLAPRPAILPPAGTGRRPTILPPVRLRNVPLVRQALFNWGRAFIPKTAGLPGGVTTDMSRAFVDKQEWPVATALALGYMPPPTSEPKPED